MTLTLCAIVKNEERFLPGMLASVRGVVDRMVLVDTGSTDRTVAIAREAGAEVIFHPWNHHFAEARNVALAQVREGWVLYLDADERLPPGAVGTLKGLLEKYNPEALSFPLQNLATDREPDWAALRPGRQGAPVLLTRLARWTPLLRFEGRIHERLVGVGPAKAVDLPIVHLGYAASVRAGKHGRNLPILLLNCEERPDDPLAWMYLAREQKMVGQDPRGALEEGWKVAGPSHPMLAGLTTMRGQQQLEDGNPIAALETLQRARTWGIRHPNLRWLEARSKMLLALQHPDPGSLLGQAEAALREVQGTGEIALPEPLVEGVGGWRSAEDLGIVLLMQGRPAEAMSLFGEGESGRLGRWECRIHLGEGLLEEMSRHLGPASPADLWALLGQAFEGAGHRAESLEATRMALGRMNWLAPHRRVAALQRLQRLGAPR